MKGLGEGGQGVVQLEKEEKSGKLRAVKKLFVGSSERLALDVKRELCHLVAVRDVSVPWIYGEPRCDEKLITAASRPFRTDPWLV